MAARRARRRNVLAYRGDPTRLTVASAARLLGVSRATMRRWDASGLLRASRDLHTQYRIYLRADVEAFRRDVLEGERW